MFWFLCVGKVITTRYQKKKVSLRGCEDYWSIQAIIPMKLGWTGIVGEEIVSAEIDWGGMTLAINTSGFLISL
ncbi:MAG: hypothetical protein KAS48_04800 [Gammaproteobacteria bacterium]|nr:hypothetical protein [Gammaproteobacteria bacterium]